MSHCHDEHKETSHGHDHDHEHNDGNGETLYPFIDTTKIEVMNEADINTITYPFKPYHERHDRTRPLSSYFADPELIIYVPFTEVVDIKSICIFGGKDGYHPRDIKLYTNRNDIDFETTIPPLQTLQIAEDYKAEIDYPLEARKFQGVSSITLFITETWCGGQSVIHYIGFKGASKKWRRGPVEAVYESRPMPSDHKIENPSSYPAIS
uniref:Uncharacterized protein AlNc14C94G5797 n=1 Tax=Albugo laibachii Nc14 TaxID=890382 RepID=F0WGS0_9STRA|nr:conserved hypothetical protein [Albugo laibachii Nc14]|eukprot:CCA20434.1 conserved hypothetical protein [Albugo laibachii Nc14]